ncbi:polysaccharide deacetylase family protein [Coraliomargarita parva]|uniref:polysaccharide deacetylase family protein n=1 Tax=Coraliomargarita parva TaxID=3014050 RepID=UPI0022B3F0F8|nr:polysaccharide deacetylase family protein [Coraliomargarita parva]
MSIGMLMSGMLSLLYADPIELSICKFKDNKAAAVSLTFDDGILDQYTIARPLLNEHQMPATFFVVTNAANTALERRSDPSLAQKMSWEQIAQLSDEGHEIGNHSLSHKIKLVGQNEAVLNTEVTEAAAMIEEQVGIRPVSFAFPWNAYDEQSLGYVMASHLNARTQQYGIGRNFRIHHAEAWVERLTQKRAWGVAMLHAIIPDYHGYDPLPNGEADFAALLDLLQSHREDLWIATFGEVSMYTQLRNASELHWLEDGHRFIIRTELDTSVYNIPLTVRVTEGEDWKLITVYPNQVIDL